MYGRQILDGVLIASKCVHSFLACYDVWVLVTNGLDGLRGVPSSWFSIIINGVGVLPNSKWSTTR